MKLFTEASLSDSYIYQELNKSSRVSTTIIQAIKTGSRLDSSFIEEQLIQIKRSTLSPLTERVINAFQKGQIILIYNKQVRVSTSLPFLVLTVGGKTSSYIFISDFSHLTKDGMGLSIEMKKLYVLMETAYVGLMFYTNPIIFTRSTTLLRLFSGIYAGMAMKIFNKEAALSLDKDLYDRVNYTMARFELERINQVNTPALIEAYAAAACNNPSPIIIKNISVDYTAAAITSVNELISFIANLSPKLAKMNFRYYFERWISTYGTGATLSVDAFPYLYYMVVNTLLGAFLVNVTAMNDIVKNAKNINLFYSEILKLVG